ncbi:MAG: hypothetical protein WC378_03095 [Opitutaceae bacterium]|jgi:hypothetical protein
MPSLELPPDVLITSGARIPAIADWLLHTVWSSDRFGAVPREEYLRTGEAAVAHAEELISLGAARIWDELVAETTRAPTPRSFLGLDVPPASKSSSPRAVVVFDGLSLRELPLLLALARQTGFRVDESRAIATSLPTETIDFVAQRVLGPDAAHGLGPSQLPSVKALKARGIHADYLDSLTPRITLPTGKSLLLWSTWPDRLFKNDEARFDTQLFPQFCDHVATLWKYTVQAIPPGVPIVITSDHGYIFFGGTAESARESSATKELGQHRNCVFEDQVSYPAPHPDLQCFPAQRLAMLRGRLKTRPKGNSSRHLYQHGGFSLMEVLVPWLVLNRN